MMSLPFETVFNYPFYSAGYALGPRVLCSAIYFTARHFAFVVNGYISLFNLHVKRLYKIRIIYFATNRLYCYFIISSANLRIFEKYMTVDGSFFNCSDIASALKTNVSLLLKKDMAYI